MKRRLPFLKLPAALAIAFVLLSGAKAFSQTFTPTHDSYVASSNTTTNYGSRTTLLSTYSTGYSGVTRIVYLKFDLSSFSGSASNATLKLYGGLDAAIPNNYSVYAVSNTSWLETSITYYNMPALGAALQSLYINSTTDKWWEWNSLDEYINQELAAGRKTITLAVRPSPSSSSAVTFSSSEASSSVRPQLVIIPCNTPTIALGSTPAVCGGTTTTTLPYGATTNSPTLYSISWSSAAQAQGFGNITNATLPAGAISLAVPRGAAGGTYTGTLTVKNTNGCSSTGYPVSVTVNPMPVITQLPLTKLFSYYELNGNAADAMGNNNGTLQGAPTAIADRFNMPNSSYNFNGTSQYVSTGLLLPHPMEFTASLWFKTTSTTGGYLIGFGSAQTGPSTSYDRHLYMDDAGRVLFGVFPGTVQTIHSPLSYNDGNWHLATASLSPTAGMVLYVDGVQVAANQDIRSAEAFNGYCRIGYNSLAGWPSVPTSLYFKGAIDDIAVFYPSLTAAEVSALYRSPDGAGNSGPVCGGNNMTLSATTVSGASYVWSGPNGYRSTEQNPTILNADLYSGVYSVQVSLNGCSVTAHTAVVATTSGFSYAGSPYCAKTGTATITKMGGALSGTFTASPAGLSLNAATGAVDLAASTPGTYTVTNRVSANGCVSVSTAAITILPQPSATISYALSPYCAAGTANVTLTGNTGGSFSSTPAGLSLNAATGAIALSESNLGSYTVTYTIAPAGGCPQVQVATTVAVDKTTWKGTVSTNWGTVGNWNCPVLPSAGSNVVIPSGVANQPVLGGGQTGYVNNLTIQPGASLTVSNATLNIGGAVTNQGTLTASNAATVQFSGTAAQTIPAGVFAGNTVYNLTNANQVSLTLEGPLAVTNVLLLNDGVLYTKGNLTLKSTAARTASVGKVLSTAATPIVGDVTVERYVPGRRKYRLMASSVTTSSKAALSTGEESLSLWGQWQNSAVTAPGVGTLITGGTAADGFDLQTPNPSLYTYNDATRKFVPFSSANGKKTKYTPLQTGRAYYMFVYGDRVNSISTSNPNATVLKSKGALAVGTQVFNATSPTPLTAAVNSFTLLGNPYACAIDWKAVQRSGVSNTVWGWDANLSSTGGYVTVTVAGSAVIVAPMSAQVKINRFIQPGQGFFVQTTTATPQLIITEASKTIADTVVTNNVFRTADADAPPALLAINLLYTSAGSPVLADGAVAAFDASFSSGVTTEEDALKMAGSAESIGLTEGSTLLSINSRPLPQGTDALTLSIARLTKAQYTLEIFGQNLSGAAPVKAFLHDAYLNVKTPLSLADTNRIPFSVVSSVAASSAANRFRIVFEQDNTLPVAFTGITATRKPQGVAVNWEVAFEENVVRYEVERSADGRTFAKAGEVAPKGSPAAAYAWLDTKPAAGTRWYRVRSVDADGSFGYSKTVMAVMATGQPALAVYPNPVRHRQVNIQLKDLAPCTVTAYLFDRNGTQVLQQAIDHKGGTAWYQLVPRTKLAAGMYVLRVATQTETFSQMVMLE